MFNKSGIAVTALVAGMVVAFANGAAAEGGYVSLMGGYTILQDNTLSGERADKTLNVDAVKLDDSFIGGIAIGYSFKDPWRVEVEATYQNFDIDSILNEANTALVPGNGDVDVVTGLVNAIYEHRDSGSSWTPYIGAGIGLVYVNANDVQRPGRSAQNDDGIAPTGVILLGVDYDLDENVALTAGYRFQGIVYASGDTTKVNGTTFSGDADAIFLHSVTAGLRFRF